jgi:hypothetical protein
MSGWSEATVSGGRVPTWQVYHEFRRDRAERREIKIVSQDCLEFSDDEAGIDLVSLEQVTVAPRPGDTVCLPGETRDSVNYVYGVYEVERVSYWYVDACMDEESIAQLVRESLFWS